MGAQTLITHKPYAGYAAFIAVCVNLLAVKPYPITDLQIVFFLTSMFFHALALSVPQPSITAIVTLHASGILASETLICVMLPPHSWLSSYYIINAFFFLFACFFFKDYIIHFLRQYQQDTTSQPHHTTDLEAQHQEPEEIQ
ncbi:hypothetical protein VNO80_30046 [Phaseolus coccineus]|uniref:Uncharacterized protein n=1 Tax=Phaseolus coccineus TaxID=3886 RepID=A0AAN9LD71_PHACN